MEFSKSVLSGKYLSVIYVDIHLVYFCSTFFVGVRVSLVTFLLFVMLVCAWKDGFWFSVSINRICWSIEARSLSSFGVLFKFSAHCQTSSGVQVFQIPGIGLMAAMAHRSPSSGSAVYLWTSSGFRLYQNISTHGALAWRHFNLGKKV